MLFENPLHKAFENIIMSFRGSCISLRWCIYHVVWSLDINRRILSRISLCCLICLGFYPLALKFLLLNFLELNKMIMVLHFDTNIVDRINLSIWVNVWDLMMTWPVYLIVALSWIALNGVIQRCIVLAWSWRIDNFTRSHMSLAASLCMELLAATRASRDLGSSFAIENGDERKVSAIVICS